MTKVAIVGAGRVGVAAAKLLLTCTESEIVLIDSSEDALTDGYADCSKVPRTEMQVLSNPTIPVSTYITSSIEEIEETLKSVDAKIVICSTPFFLNVAIAEVCKRLGLNYIDFTEDVSVTKGIHALEITDQTFVPQTGLAPGLVNYVGLALFQELGEPKSLALRVGALPQVSFGPAHYAITWSPEGLVNEYLKDAERKVNGVIETIPPLDDLETLIVHGTEYEGFTTSGGVGSLSAYDHIPSVEYKTLRYPGHLEVIQKLLNRVEFDFDSAVEIVKDAFERTRQDVVVLVAYGVDVNGEACSTGMHFYPCEDLGLTALELTTAGTGVAIVELMLAEKLPLGTLTCAQIPFDELMQTNAMQLVFEYMS